MARAEGPLLPRRRLGVELRRLRGDRTLEQVAEDTMISTSKLSRLENGHGVPQPRDIRDLIAHYEADAQAAKRLRDWTNAGRKQAWWNDHSSFVSESQRSYLEFESGASTIRTYSLSIIPGLLQTPTYTQNMIRAIRPGWNPEQIAQFAQVRERRQENFFSSENPALLVAVIDEAALSRQISSHEENHSQLDRLTSFHGSRKVTIQVLPFRAGAHAGLMEMFTVFQFSDDIDRDVVSVETHFGDRFLEEESSVLDYLRRFDAVGRRALSAADSHEFLLKMMSNNASPKD